MLALTFLNTRKAPHRYGAFPELYVWSQSYLAASYSSLTLFQFTTDQKAFR